jgi:hypothetical protein
VRPRRYTLPAPHAGHPAPPAGHPASRGQGGSPCWCCWCTIPPIYPVHAIPPLPAGRPTPRAGVGENVLLMGILDDRGGGIVGIPKSERIGHDQAPTEISRFFFEKSAQ